MRIRQVVRALAMIAVVAPVIIYLNVEHFDPSPTACVPVEMPTDRQEPESLRFMAIGCHGTGEDGQHAVSAAMARARTKMGADFVLFLGDNVYPSGVASTSDPLWSSRFESVYPTDEFPVKFYAALGNHDYKSSPQAQIAYTKHSERWRMPHQHHCFEGRLADGTTYAFFAFDTEQLKKWYKPAGWAIEWLEAALTGSDADWKVVFGHNPLWASGRYGDYPRLQELMAPVLRRHNVQIYLSAHEHHLEVVHPQSGLLPVISGAGAHLRAVHGNERTAFAASTLGFSWFELGPRSGLLRMVDTRQRTLFEQRIPRRQRPRLPRPATTPK